MDCKQRFAFIEFNESSGAEEAIQSLDQSQFQSERMNVQPHKPSVRVVRGPPAYQVVGPSHGDRSGLPSGRDRRTQFRVLLFNLDDRASWQDLKDFGRNVGEVNFANVFLRGGRKTGVVEYFTFEAMKRALEELHGRRLYDRRVHIEEDSGQFEPLLPVDTRGDQETDNPTEYCNNDYRGGPPTPVIRQPFGGRSQPVLIQPPQQRGGYDVPPRGSYRSRSRSPPGGGYDYVDTRGSGGDRDYRRREYRDVEPRIAPASRDYRYSDNRGSPTARGRADRPRGGHDMEERSGGEFRESRHERGRNYGGGGGGNYDGGGYIEASRGGGTYGKEALARDGYKSGRGDRYDGDLGEVEYYDRRNQHPHSGSELCSSRMELEEGRGGRDRRVTPRVYEEEKPVRRRSGSRVEGSAERNWRGGKGTSRREGFRRGNDDSTKCGQQTHRSGPRVKEEEVAGGGRYDNQAEYSSRRGGG
eukprot:GHVS01039889.1.p1 GENE.GHVS01039889.1~~GHVS01039889.1.p1  ORF type:complete len:471 (+),score=80.60 GHVS01039889.1:118-1530(+)